MMFEKHCAANKRFLTFINVLVLDFQRCTYIQNIQITVVPLFTILSQQHPDVKSWGHTGGGSTAKCSDGSICVSSSLAVNLGHD